jgi:TrmH family RNA methyltransferase
MNGKSIYETSFRQKKILIMGNEGKGVSDGVRSFVDHEVSIPAFFEANDGPESLNVAVASSIIVSEMKRR